MKSIITLFIALAAMSFQTFAQSNVIDKLFTDYKAQENFSSITVTGKMFELAGYIEVDENDEDMQDLMELITTIESFQLIAGKEVSNLRSQYTQAADLVSKTYEELLRVEDADGHFSFFIDESRGIVNEAVMVGRTNNELIIGSLTGRMDLKELSKMTAKIQSGDFSYMEKLNRHGAAELKVYPNPAKAGADVQIDIPEDMIGGSLTVYNMEGRQMNTIKANNKSQSLQSNSFAEGKYIVEIEKDGVQVKRSFVIQSK